MKTEANAQRVLNLLDVPMRPTEIQARTGWAQADVMTVLLELKTAGLAKTTKDGGKENCPWISSDAVMRQQCRWTDAQVLEELGLQPLQLWRLEALSGSKKMGMRLQLERLQREGHVKRINIRGTGRCWALATHKVFKPGEATKRPTVRLDQLERFVAKHQPVKLQALADHFGRGVIYIRGRMGLLRKKGTVKHDALGGSYSYVMASYQRPIEDMHAEILRRCEENEDGCLRWDGAHSPDGHPLFRYDGSPKRVDILLWTVIHRKRLKKGNTLTYTCDMRGCCNHEHHKQVTRGEAVKKRMRETGFGGEKHGAAVAEALRRNANRKLLPPEQVQRIRESTKSGREIAREENLTPSVVGSLRSGRTYRHYGQPRLPATPFAGLGARAA